MNSFEANNRNFKIDEKVRVWYRGIWYDGIVVEFRPRQLRYPKSIFDDGVECGKNLELIREDDNGWVSFKDLDDIVMCIKTSPRITKNVVDSYDLVCTKNSDIIFENEKEYDPISSQIYS